MEQVIKFCRILRSRSIENQRSFGVLFYNGLYANCFAVLRQELDSMIRVIYLLNAPESQRELLIQQTLNGEKWSFINSNGKKQFVTDKDMVDLANTLNGWTQSVYKFGCAFIHLSNFHDYQAENPFLSLEDSEKDSIIHQMHYYHGANLIRDSSLDDIIPFLPSVMDKISANFKCEIQSLENKIAKA